MSRESKLDEILNSISVNALDLPKSGYSDMQMIKTAVNRSSRLLRGKISEQDVIDIGAIGLALLLHKIPECKNETAGISPLLRNAPGIDPQET